MTDPKADLPCGQVWEPAAQPVPEGRWWWDLRNGDIVAPSGERLADHGETVAIALNNLEAEVATLRVKAELADRAATEFRWLINPKQGEIHFPAAFVTWLAEYDALEK